MIKSFLILEVVIFYSFSFPQSAYNLESVRETALIGTGVSASSLAIYLLSKVEPPTQDEIKNLSRTEVNNFDRFVTYNWSPAVSDISDVLLITQTISPLLLLSSQKIRDNYKNYIVMNIELYLLYYGSVHITKSLSGRYRPYMYNDEVPLEEKMKYESMLSFFSGHSTFSFASAVFISTIYAKNFPDSKWKTLVWGSSLLIASITASLRVISGMHFLSDVITGAIVGSLLGYMIPAIHESGLNQSENKIRTEKQNLINITIPF
jgi:PAP2 superfamily